MPMFITALFKYSQAIQYLPRCPSAYEWIEEMWCAYTKMFIQLLGRIELSQEDGSMNKSTC